MSGDPKKKLDIADLVEPVPDSCLPRSLTAAEREATKKTYRAQHRLRTQEKEVVTAILNQNQERAEGGATIRETKKRVPHRPVSASQRTTPMNTPRTGTTSPRDHSRPASAVKVPSEFKGFQQLAQDREQLVRDGRLQDAASLVYTPGPTPAPPSRPGTAGSVKQRPGTAGKKSTTPPVPSLQMSNSPALQFVSNSAAEGERLASPKKPMSMSERIGVLNSGCVTRSKARDSRMGTVETRKTYRTGPLPAAPSSCRSKPSNAGIKGADVKLSHFIDANEFDDSGGIVPVEGDSSSIGYSRYYVSTTAEKAVKGPASGTSSSTVGSKPIRSSVPKPTAPQSTKDEDVEDGNTLSSVMEPCKILSYNPDSFTYTIRWIRTGKTKSVKPLNLQFHHESPEAYQQRVARAERYRDAAEADLRFVEYIEMADNVEDPVELSEQLMSKVLSLVAVDFPKKHVDLVEKCIEEVEVLWRFSIKKAMVLYRLQNREERERLRDLRLPEQPPGPTPCLRGLISTLPVVDETDPNQPHQYNRDVFRQRRKFLSQELFAAHPSLRVCEEYAVNRWSLFEGALLIETALDVLKPPLSVVDYNLRQSRHNERLGNALKVEWVSSIASVMQSELANTFNFYEDDTDKFHRSRMYRFLRRINLCLTGQLQGLVYDSVDALQKFLDDLVVREDLLKAAQDEMQGHNRKNGNFLHIVGCVGTHCVEPPGLRESLAKDVEPEPFGIDPAKELMAGVIYGINPLLVTTLMVDTNGNLVFEPPLEHIVDAVQNTTYDAIFNSTDSVVGLGKQLFPLLEMDEIPLTIAAQQLRHEDSKIQQCKTTLHRVITENVTLAEKLFHLYKPFEYLEQIVIEDFLTEFDDDEKLGGKASLSDYDHICARLQYHMDLIKARSLNDVAFPMIKVECGELKRSLLSKATRVMNAMLRHLIRRTNNEIDTANDQYIAIHARLKVEPQNPEELRDLREYVDGVPLRMDALEQEFDRISESVQLLGKYGFMPDQAAFEKYWNSFSWPRKIGIIMDDISFQLQMFRSKFLGDLRTEVEDLQQSISDITRAVNNFSYEDDENYSDKHLKTALKIESEIEELKRRATLTNQREQIFQQPQTKFVTLKDVDKQFQPFATLWKITSESRQMDYWLDTAMDHLPSEEVVQAHTTWTREISKLSKLLSQEAPIVVVRSVKEKIEAFKENIPLILALAKPALYNRKRHVNRIAQFCNQSPKTFELRDKTMQELRKMNVQEHKNEIQELSENADHEYKLEWQLSKMKDEWQKVSFTLVPHQETFLLKDTDDVRNLIDDHIMKTQTMLASPYAAAILNEVRPWEDRLLRMSSTIDAWLQCQFGFHYLDPIFASKDIVSSMPEEHRMFEQVSNMWLQVMESVNKVPNVLSRCSEEKLIGLFNDGNTKLDKILKELQKFLDTKRIAFPRFYFLSNEDLIEILSESKDPLLVQPHLKKCFEGINRLTFTDTQDITEMQSTEGEIVPLTETVNPADVENVVEKWLTNVEKEMCNTVQDNIKRAMVDYIEMPRTKWVLKWPGQVVICASQIHWTMLVERAILENDMKQCASLVNKQLQDLVVLVRGDLSHVHMCTLQALVVLEVHAKDITNMLLEENVSSIDAFNWLSQLRYYSDKGKTVVRQTVAELPYGNEYLGNTGRLVITPLTDRCYRTLTGALHLNYGGAPEGPAGTGKTETTKDLAKAVAKQCVVFNCSDQIKAIEMEKLLRGLASSGAWGCFDEFNRIEIQVLSVIAQQVLTIQIAVAEKRLEFLFEGKMCNLKQGCSVFITMNPGYAGRAELPENLKALFRPIAMMVPDYALIAEVSLYSCGFLEATQLAKKIVSTYKLCSEQLSSQSHYDYGMRAVKAVLTAAQNLKKNEMKDAPEPNVVLRAIRDVNVPKFLINDASLFDGIISDLFGEVDISPPDYASLDEGIRTVAADANLQVTPFFDLKMKQVYEMVRVRHGVMVVGYSMSGKTAALKTLAGGLTWAKNNKKAFERCFIHTANPKSVTMSQLYGHSDASGTDWHDGILSSIFRACATNTKPDRQWIVLDGPVDALWIENMNTVLDDNKKLCLTNGDIIRMTDWMTMVFCVQDLAAASPATVSRCGMIYFEPKQLSSKPLITSWFNELPEAVKSKPMMMTALKSLLESVWEPISDYVKHHPLGVAITEQIVIAQLLRFYGLLMKDTFKDKETVEAFTAAQDFDLTCYVEGLFIYAVTWSVGALMLGSNGRQRFDKWLRTIMDTDAKNRKLKYRLSQSYPDHGDIFCFKYIVPEHFSGEARWQDWTDTIAEVPLESQLETPYHEIIVPTADSACYSDIARFLIQNNEPMMLTGETGTGKTLIYKTIMTKELDSSAYTNCFVQFSAQTTATQLKTNIERRVDRRSGRKYGPPMGKQMVILIDDLGMPDADQYGCQPPIELLRQLCSSGGWYATLKNDVAFKQIINCIVIGAMQPADAGRPTVTNRLLRHFHNVYVPPHSPETLKKIFSRLMDWIIFQPGMNTSLRNIRDNVVTFVIETFQSVCETQLPTPQKSHYAFNLRDMCRVFQGVSDVNAATTRDEISLISLVAHECLRVFSDRLINQEDREKLKGTMQMQMAKHLKRPYEFAVPDDNLHFANFAGAADDRAYVKIEDQEMARLAVQSLMEQHNSDTASRSGKLNLIIFDYVVMHVARVVRIIQQPSGSALLVGVGGSGRQSVARLATYIAGYDLRTIQVTTKYNRDAWREDVAGVLRLAGEKGMPTTFLLTDTQIKDDSFFEDVCNVLNSGEVPGLFSSDSVDQIATTLKPIAKDLGRDFDRDGCWELFVNRVRSNLHFAICFSPVGDSFRVRLRRFPSLINCTTINWFSEWPEDGLTNVGVSKLIASGIVPAEQTAAVVTIFVKMHKDVEHESRQAQLTKSQSIEAMVTPTNFLDLLSHFEKMITEQQEDIKKQRSRYAVGLETMRRTEVEVSEMQLILERNQPILEEKSKQTAELIKEIDEQTAEADKERAAVAIEEAQANKIADEARSVKEECEANLSVAMPALNAATAAVSNIDKRQLVEIKAMQNPPARVRKVMEAVCVVFEVKPKEIKDPHSNKKEYDYWTPTKSKVMADVESFRDSLINFDKENMNPEIFESKLIPYIKDRNFKPEAVKDVSQALVGVCQWVIAMETYYRVYKIVKPKKMKLAAAEEELRAATEVLDEKKAKLADIDAKLAELRANLETNISEKERLAAEQENTQTKLNRAVKLLHGLGDEKVRYNEQVEDLTARLETIMGDCMLSAGFSIYLGMFTNDVRQRLMGEWRAKTEHEGITVGSKYSLEHFLSTSLQVLRWKLQGLPADQFSIDSAILVHKGCKWPYIVDPQSQANMWIKTLEKDHNNLFTLRPSDGGYQQQIIHAVQHGYPVLLEDCEEDIDPFLYPLLLRETTVYKGQKVITLGDATVPYNDDFRMYMTTRIAKPKLLPETSTKVTIVAFFITPNGLTEQVLQRTIQHEEREQEEKKNRFIEQQAMSKQQLVELENTILEMISSGKDLLATDDVNKQLEYSKHTSSNLEHRLQEIENFQQGFEKVRHRYSVLADHVSTLFFVVQSLSNIDPMYQFSLQWYFSLLHRALETSEKNDEHSREERVQCINKTFYTVLYNNVTRSLFVKDQTVYSFLFAAKLANVPTNEVLFFVTGGIDVPAPREHPAKPDWVPQTEWQCVCRASDQLKDVFEHFSTDVAADVDGRFKAFVSESGPTLPQLPLFWEGSVTPMQRLIITRCLRPERVVALVKKFVQNLQGTEFLQPPILNLPEVVKEVRKDPATPLIFLLSPGADPMAMVRRLADDHNMLDQFDTLSLGQGMGERARQLIHDGKHKGRWVMLQNCHLYKDWMPTLDRIVEDLALNKKSCNMDFKLWLTSFPTPHFPVTLLERGLKMVVEPPSGVKANLQKSYFSHPLTDPKFFEKSEAPSVWKKLCYGLCLFHAVIQERRAFGALGWNIPYEFNDTDLAISLRQLHLFVQRSVQQGDDKSEHTSRDGLLQNSSMGSTPTGSISSAHHGGPVEGHNVSFDALQYLIGECNYGGRVTDAHDRILLKNLLINYVSHRALRPSVQFDPTNVQFPMPRVGELEAYHQAISELPDAPQPSVFGLHANASITKDRRVTFMFLDAVMATLPKDSAPEQDDDSKDGVEEESAEAADSRGQVIGIAETMLAQLRKPYDLEEIEARRPVSYSDSMNTVLHQELQRFNRLIKKIASSLKAVAQALRGEIVLSAELDAMATDINFGKIPGNWTSVSYPSLKPFGAYMNDLFKRLKMFDQWIESGPAVVHWLGGFFFPHSFITGVLQNYSRAHKVTIDSLKWDASIMRDTPHAPPASGCYITGLYLEGCGWNAEAGELGESRPGVLYEELPILYLFPVSNFEDISEDGSPLMPSSGAGSPVTTLSPMNIKKRYQCPVYRTTLRRGVLMTTGHSTNFIIHFPLPIPHGTTQEHWVKRGVALLTALNY